MTGLLAVLSDAPITSDAQGRWVARLEALGMTGPALLRADDGDCWGLLAVADHSLALGAGPIETRGQWTLATFGDMVNLPSLRREKAGRWGEHPEAPGSALAARVFTDQGPELGLNRLEGELLVVGWSSSERLLAAGRDRLGARSLLHGRSEGVSVLGSSARLLLELLPQASPQPLRTLLADDRPGCALQGFEAVGPGGLVQLRPGADARVSRWWTPPERVSEDDGGRAIWELGLEHALHLAAARRRPQGQALVLAGATGHDTLREVLKGRAVAAHHPCSAAQLGAALDQPWATPELALLLAGLRQADPAQPIFSALGADEALGVHLQRLGRRARMRQALTRSRPTPRHGRGLDTARFVQLPHTLAQAGHLAERAGLLLRAPYASADFMELASRVPLPHLRSTARGKRLFETLLPGEAAVPQLPEPHDWAQQVAKAWLDSL